MGSCLEKLCPLFLFFGSHTYIPKAQVFDLKACKLYKAIFMCYFPENKIHSFHGIVKRPVTEKKKLENKCSKGNSMLKGTCCCC